MAKVGRESIRHHGSGKEIFCEIHFSNKSKLFHIADFPEEIKLWNASRKDNDATSYSSTRSSGEIISDSYDKCVALARKVYTEFYDLQISEEKIICYQLKTNHPRPEFHGHNDKRDLFHAPSLAIGLEFRVMYRITIGDEKFISSQPYELSKKPDEGTRLGDARLSSENGHNGLYDWNKIPYTDLAHDFFKSVDNGLTEMIKKTNDFFGESPELLIEKIEQGKFLK